MANNKVIKITCEGAATIDYKKILDFQGDLKDLNEEDYIRLKTEIITYGFNSPIQIRI